MRTLRPAASAACLVAVCATFAAPAHATDCTDLPTPVYVTGSSAFESILGQLASELAAQKPPVTVVYQSQGSCAGVDAIASGTPVVGSGATAPSYWSGGGTQLQCDLPMEGVVANLAVSDVFPTTCSDLPNGLPSDVGVTEGPVQAMLFVVPAASSQTVISAEAAYFAFGFGADSGVAPWTNPSFLFTRDETSGTEQMIATAIGVPATQWKGTAAMSTSDMLLKVKSASDPEKTLGIIAADAADSNRATITTLAYQHFDQTCGYYPDSDPSSFDKRNVRDGHYAIWGPLHLIYKKKDGYPIDPNARQIVAYIEGTQAPPGGIDVIKLEALAHVVPQCAMRVSRVDELGALASFAPDNPCGCYFEQIVGGSTSCAPCSTVSQCPAGARACNHGYCED